MIFLILNDDDSVKPITSNVFASPPISVSLPQSFTGLHESRVVYKVNIRDIERDIKQRAHTFKND